MSPYYRVQVIEDNGNGFVRVIMTVQQWNTSLWGKIRVSAFSNGSALWGTSGLLLSFSDRKIFKSFINYLGSQKKGFFQETAYISLSLTGFCNFPIFCWNNFNYTTQTFFSYNFIINERKLYVVNSLFDLRECQLGLSHFTISFPQLCSQDPSSIARN